MKIKVEIELTEQQAKTLCKYAIERMINRSIDIATELIPQNDSEDDRANINKDDWEILKPIVMAVWNPVREATFIEINK